MAIDKTKGIVCKPMPKYWYDYRSIEKPVGDDPDELKAYELNRRIVANRKPYFMRYIYPQTMRDYKSFISKANFSCLAEFRMRLDALESIPVEERTGEMREFINSCKRLNPISDNDGVMNRICRKIEAEFAGGGKEDARAEFDYSIMKSGAEYNKNTFYEIKKLYDRHCQRMSELAATHDSKVTSKMDTADYRASVLHKFHRDTAVICNNLKEACDIVLDICYKRNSTKQFAWDVSASMIVANLLEKSGGVMAYPVQDPDGDIEYRGRKYSMMEIKGVRDGYSVR